MAILVLDPTHEAQGRKMWPGLDDDRRTEVWEGVVVMSPLVNNEHQNLVIALGSVFWAVVESPGLGLTHSGVNLSDRTPNWVENYRNPDVTVYLNGNPAADHGTHYVGGPDFAVEVVSPSETPAAKFAFYAAVGTRELLIVYRDPWKLELFALEGGVLTLAGSSTLSSPAVCTSVALGLTLQLVEGTRRPRIAVTHPATGLTWSV